VPRPTSELTAGTPASTADETGKQRQSSTGRSAFLVASGILLSRIAGLVRERVFAHYFGNSAAADAFKSAFRIPNFLQNLFGEGVLSASFIPVYAGLLARGNEKEAGRVAGAIAAILGLVTSALVLAGVLLTPVMIDLIAPGFTGEKRELTINLVRILFPGAGLLVLSAWCLGILNSHRRFFLSYTAPVIWNIVMIGSLVMFGSRMGQFPLAEAVAWGSVVGSGLQFVVQLPAVLRLVKGLTLTLGLDLPSVRTVLRNFIPVFISRGVVQISAYVDNLLASFLPSGAVAALGYAQTLYTLPVSLFGMAVSAAELPAMSSAVGTDEEVAAYLHKRLNAGLRRIAFYIVPSAMAFLALGDVVTAAIYQSGAFKHEDTIYVWIVLAGSTVGLLASTLGRLYSSTYYALRDTRTPLKYAIVRVVLTTVLGYLCAIPLISVLGIDTRYGVAGLTASAGVAGWVEFALLRRKLNKRIGTTGLEASYLLRLWTSALLAAAAGFGLKLVVAGRHPVVTAIIVFAPYGLIYFAAAAAFGVAEAREVVGKARRRVGRGVS
jgi:putative peptidoglycan lipid II flippase